MNGRYNKHSIGNYEYTTEDRARLNRIITSRPKPPPRVLIGRWVFRLMVAALVIQALAIIWLKWDSSICRALLVS